MQVKSIELQEHGQKELDLGTGEDDDESDDSSPSRSWRFMIRCPRKRSTKASSMRPKFKNNSEGTR